jgi:ribosome-associated protein
MSKKETVEELLLAMDALDEKKAEGITLLELPAAASGLADYFLIGSGNNPPQVQAIIDAVDEKLSKQLGVEPQHREGYQNAEWVLLDYVDFVVHIFSANSRRFYDLERLWQSAKHLTAADLEKALRPAPKKAAAKASAKPAAKKPAAKKTVVKKTAVKAAAKKTAKPAVKKAAVKKVAAKVVVKKAAGKKVAAKAVAKKAAKPVAKKAVTKAVAKKVVAGKPAAKKTAARKKK